MFSIPFPVLLCDIGGTNARFAIATAPDEPITWIGLRKTADFPTFIAAVKAVARGIRASSMLVCAAGPVQGTRVALTNCSWQIDGFEAREELGLSQGLIFNDFEALALSLPILTADALRPIGNAASSREGVRVAHGPGTGLGTAALISAEGKWVAIASEGSHSDFAPVREDEKAFWPFVEPRLGRITPESLISGPGLRRLHRARQAASGLERPDMSEVEITRLALASPRSEEAETVRCFWRLVARYAGDISLTFLATGGVYLAGGVLPRLVALLDEHEFRTCFEQKAPYRDLVAKMPVDLIISSDAVLRGMASIASHPDFYSVDYARRAWNTA